MQEIKCARCGSWNVEVYVHPKDVPKPARMTMAEWQKAPTVTSTPAVMVYVTEVAHCRNCGYTIEKIR